ncbi:MAG: hypothetical protein U0269_17030 [Polyangiales bacterium]
MTEGDPQRDEAGRLKTDAKVLGFSTQAKAVFGVFAGGPLIIGALAGALGPVVGPIGPLLWLLVLGTLAVVGTKRDWFSLVEKPGDVTVSRAGVAQGGRLVADRKKVNNAAIVRDPRGVGTRILLGKKGSPRRLLALRAKDDGEAHKILHELGLDADASTASWSTLGGAMYASWGIWAQMFPFFFAFALAALAGLAQSLVPVPFAVMSLVAFYASIFTKTNVVVGADGVLVKWLHLQRFCSFRDVEFVERLINGVRLHRKNAAPFDVTIATQQQIRNDRFNVMSTEVEALYNRINEAMQVRDAQPDALVASDPFLRNARTAREWLDAAKKLFEPVAGLRSAVHTEESAWRVVADSAASEEARIGAAAALATNADDRGREKLRAVAENVASTRVRVAIEAAAKGDDDALIDVMEAVVKESPGAASKK